MVLWKTLVKQNLPCRSRSGVFVDFGPLTQTYAHPRWSRNPARSGLKRKSFLGMPASGMSSLRMLMKIMFQRTSGPQRVGRFVPSVEKVVDISSLATDRHSRDLSRPWRLRKGFPCEKFESPPKGGTGMGSDFCRRWSSENRQPLKQNVTFNPSFNSLIESSSSMLILEDVTKKRLQGFIVLGCFGPKERYLKMLYLRS